jgi:hypothetical protein
VVPHEFSGLDHHRGDCGFRHARGGHGILLQEAFHIGGLIVGYPLAAAGSPNAPGPLLGTYLKSPWFADSGIPDHFLCRQRGL